MGNMAGKTTTFQALLHVTSLHVILHVSRSRHLVLGFLLALLMVASFGVQAAGLGRVTVHSGIGQPLQAEIPISATSAELASGLIVRMASHQEFANAGIEFLPLLAGIRFTIDQGVEGAPVLRLATDDPVNEPFLHFLIELSWPAGRMVREYTLLLAPPETLQPAVLAPATTAATRAGPPQAPPEKSHLTEVLVKPGDTLSRIARQHKDDTVSLDQMLVALFNRNPEAFSGENMNRLRAGRILRLPEPSEAAHVDPVAARRMIVAQAVDFDEYRRRLAAAASTEPAIAAAPRQEAAGRIIPEVQVEAAPAAPTRDKLEVSRTELAKDGGQAGALVTEEDLVARDNALREANERIAQLEKNIENLQRLLEIRSEVGAQVQQKTGESAAPLAPTLSVAPVVPASAQPLPQLPAEPPPPPPGFFKEHFALLVGGAVILALLMGYLGYLAWRPREQKRTSEKSSDLGDSGDSDDSGNPGDSADAPPKAVLAPALAVAGADAAELPGMGETKENAALTTEGDVDPVVKAEALMTDGRDRQAEDILEEALESDPDRTAIHPKPAQEPAYETASEITQEPAWEPAQEPAHETTQAPAQEPSASAPERVAREDGSLDFDLGPASTGALPAAQADADTKKPAADEVMSLDFDFDLELDGMAKSSAQAEVSPEPAALDPVAAKRGLGDGVVVDFDLELGTPPSPPVQVEPTPAFVDIAPEAGEPSPKTASKPADDFADMDMLLDIDLPDVKPANESADFPDLSDLPDLDKDVEYAAQAGAVSSGMGTGDVKPRPVMPDDPEVAMKLELAQAYEEMGDREGARELLGEVLNEGSPAQREQARLRLERIA